MLAVDRTTAPTAASALPLAKIKSGFSVLSIESELTTLHTRSGSVNYQYAKSLGLMYLYAKFSVFVGNTHYSLLKPYKPYSVASAISDVVGTEALGKSEALNEVIE